MVDVVDGVDSYMVLVVVSFNLLWISPFGYAVFKELACFCFCLLVFTCLCGSMVSAALVSVERVSVE